jgi:hypothetical protein
MGATLAALLHGCASAPAPEPTKGDKKTVRAAAKRARQIARDSYKAVRRGRCESMQTLLAPEVFALGPRPQDVFTSRSAAVIAAGKDFAMSDRHRLRSRMLLGASSRSGSSAWIVDRIDIDRKPHTLAAVLAKIDDIWYVVAIQVARAHRGKGKSLAPLPGGVHGGAREVVPLVEELLATPTKLTKQLAKYSYTALTGPRARDNARGRRRIARLWKKRKHHKTPLEAVGGFRAGVTPDGAVAWVAANTRAAGASSDAPQQRMLWIYEHAPKGWHLVALQIAAP